MDIVRVAGFAVLGFVLVCWATPLSLRYNAWTTRFREQHPEINPPPTPAWRSRNTRIMTVLFRVLGVSLILLSALQLLAFIGSKAR
jgi:hypothetical protein